MEKAINIQVQSILYHNEKNSILQAVTAMANAVRVYKKLNGSASINVTFLYGDSSAEPLLTDQDVTQINKQYSSQITFMYRFFGFNTGSAKGHNLLAKGFRGDYYVIMNPDVKVSSRFFIEILKPFEDLKVGLVEAKQIPLEHPKKYDEKTLITEWATTACVAIQKSAFDQVYGFDAETFFLYCDDLDFSWRLRLAGWKLVYQPLAPVYHAKKLGNDAKWLPTNAEVYYSALAQMLIAYKFSNNKRAVQLMNYFLQLGGSFAEAAEEYKQICLNGKLPKQLDPTHEISKFVGDYYTEQRFYF